MIENVSEAKSEPNEVENELPDNSWRSNPNVIRNGPNVIAGDSSISLAPEAIQGIIAAAVTAAVQAANKPKPKTEQELAEIAMAQEQRKEMAESLKRAKTNARYFAKHICSHEHNRRDGGGTYCVYVKDNDHLGDPGYIYCQGCCGRFRPDDLKWRKLDPDAIFDTAKFNLLYQHCAQAQGDILG
jgi:hypothetical protein